MPLVLLDLMASHFLQISTTPNKAWVQVELLKDTRMKLDGTLDLDLDNQDHNDQ